MRRDCGWNGFRDTKGRPGGNERRRLCEALSGDIGRLCQGTQDRAQPLALHMLNKPAFNGVRIVGAVQLIFLEAGW
jgi:hypothetical protein